MGRFAKTSTRIAREQGNSGDCSEFDVQQRTAGDYIFRRVEDSTTTAGSSVELLTLEDTDPEAVSSLLFSGAFLPPPSPECPKNKNRAKKTVLSIFSGGLKTLLLQQAHPSTC